MSEPVVWRYRIKTDDDPPLKWLYWDKQPKFDKAQLEAMEFEPLFAAAPEISEALSLCGICHDTIVMCGCVDPDKLREPSPKPGVFTDTPRRSYARSSSKHWDYGKAEWIAAECAAAPEISDAMVERAAKAIAEARGVSWFDSDGSYKLLLLRDARAVLEARKEGE